MTTPRHMPGLDSVRGLACLMVLVGHATMTNDTGGLPLPDLYRSALGFFAGPGVDLFFVLSGFLITGILIDALGTRNYFGTFYARRALRILPLYYVALALAFIVARPLLHDMRGYDATAADQWWLWAHLTNWKHAIDGQPPWWWLNHFWSLAVEEQFYLVWPALVYATRGGRSLPIVCGAIIALSPAARTLVGELVIMPDPDRLTPLRLDGLGAGALLAWAVRRPEWSSWRPRVLVAGCLAAAALVLLPHGAAPIHHTVLNLAAAGMVCWASTGDGWRAGAPLRYLGRRSYGAYVYHFPIMCALALWWPYARTLPPIVNHLAFLALSGSLTLLVAEASWRCLEAPALRLRGWKLPRWWGFTSGTTRAYPPAAR